MELTAVDASGLRTTRRIFLVGGVDYRAFPWPAIAAAMLLLAAALGTGRRSNAGDEVRPAAGNDP